MIYKIILNSGVTNHIFYNQNLITNLEPTKNDQYVLIANGMKTRLMVREILIYFQQRLKMNYI
jgi:hypothetical protein